MNIILLAAVLISQAGLLDADDPAALTTRWMEPICEDGGGWRRASALRREHQSLSGPALFTVIGEESFFRAAA